MASLSCVEDKMKTSGLVKGGTTITTTSQSTLLEEMKLLKDQSGFILLSSSKIFVEVSFLRNFLLCGFTFMTKKSTLEKSSLLLVNLFKIPINWDKSLII